MKSIKKLIGKENAIEVFKSLKNNFDYKISYKDKLGNHFKYFKGYLRWYRRALNDNNGNYKCGFCGELNTFFDDIGFFYPPYLENGKWINPKTSCGCEPVHTGDR